MTRKKIIRKEVTKKIPVAKKVVARADAKADVEVARIYDGREVRVGDQVYVLFGKAATTIGCIFWLGLDKSGDLRAGLRDKQGDTYWVNPWSLYSGCDVKVEEIADRGKSEPFDAFVLGWCLIDLAQEKLKLLNVLHVLLDEIEDDVEEHDDENTRDYFPVAGLGTAYGDILDIREQLYALEEKFHQIDSTPESVAMEPHPLWSKAWACFTAATATLDRKSQGDRWFRAVVLDLYLQAQGKALRGNTAELIEENKGLLNDLQQAPECELSRAGVEIIRAALTLIAQDGQPLNMTQWREAVSASSNPILKEVQVADEAILEWLLEGLFFSGLCFSQQYPGTFVNALPMGVPLLVDSEACKLVFGDFYSEEGSQLRLKPKLFHRLR